MTPPRTPWRGAATTILCSAALGLAACGGDGDSKTTSATPPSAATPSKNAQIAARVPAAIRSKRTLAVASDASYAPIEFIAEDGKTVVGVDADLAKAIAAVMGLKAKLVNTTFDGIIPGLAAHKYDVAMSAMTDTKEREKVVNFVTYFSAGTSFFTKAQGGADVKTLADLCGKKVAVEKGTTQAADATAQSKKCKAAGKPAVDLLVFPDQNGANLALISGRAQLGMADSPIGAYQVKQTKGKLKLVGQEYGTGPYGIAIPKDIKLQRAMLAAVKTIISDGTYASILKKWGQQDGAIDDPKVNAAVQ